jgi:DNA-directed RNA polymerase subunit RPC12/RpoP
MNDSLIAKSGQLALFRSGLASLVIGTIVMMVAPRVHDALPIYVAYPVGVMLAIGGGVFLATRIRCPHCRSRIIWDALCQHPAELQEALYRSSCRRCGHVP